MRNRHRPVGMVGLPTLRRRPILVGAALTSMVICLAGPHSADARVNPLVVIQRQIHKANMLIVLDTSGSMTGVPGGQFANSTECGVDCDDGDNCRQGGVQGICNSWKIACLSDDDCRRGYCQKDGITICNSNSDCPQDSGKCSITGGTCSTQTDCPPQTGTCSASQTACSSQSDCPSVGKCKYNSSTVCNNPGGTCADIGTCSLVPTQTCMSNSDCPVSNSPGTCSDGGTPYNGCKVDLNCPSHKLCQASGDTCRTDTDCPVYTRGTCSGGYNNGHRCYSNNDCSWGGGKCVIPANPCLGNDNLCNRPQDVCQMHSDNSCTAATNTCSIPQNTCVFPPTNVCQLPVSMTDTCVPSPLGTPGPIRMCKAAQTVCAKNSDCGSNDSCGPATSRAVVAKRAISKVVLGNYDLVNFGLMTFWQDDYFPYYQVPSGGTAQTITEFKPEQQLAQAGCYYWDGFHHVGPGPTANCWTSGTNMTLRPSADSRYRVRTDWHTWVNVDADFCGDPCNLPDGIGLGDYQGSYYQYQRTTAGYNQTLLTRDTYDGKLITVNGQNYSYYQPVPTFYNGGTPPPIDVADCGSACSATCGGRWDTQLAPFLDTTDDPVKALAAAQAIAARMELASNGGLITYWGTPTGCTLENNVAQTPNASAYNYMQAVQNGDSSRGIPRDHLACRENFVLLVTDGAANGPGDVDGWGNSICATNACAAANPVTAGCTCRSVLAAYHLNHNLGVKTFVVGFSGDAKAGQPLTINDNIARAGGTDQDDDGLSPFSYLAQSESELEEALQLAIFKAAKGSYSTAPTSTSAGTQQATTVAEGKYALDSRMDFPEWKGHLLAYDLSGSTPTVPYWDAYTVLHGMNWWERRIYTWDGNNMVKFQIDPSTKALTNKGQLAALGLGATPDEAEKVAHWVMGDPTYGNPAILGAIINSTPIDVASPGYIPLPGGHDFFTRYQNRPHLIYVGSSDAMLHAFFLEPTTVGSTTFPKGTEAFAFAPPEMLPTMRKLYSQGGQTPDPFHHIFGMADSPKAKTLCVQNCTDEATAVWKTLLMMTEGYGGSESFMLDVTNPFSSTGLADPPVTVQWHTNYGASKGDYDAALGNTISLPAFFFNKTSSLADFRVVFTSGYGVTDGSTTQGRTLISASAASGTIANSYPLTPAATCSQEYTALTDVATARDFVHEQDDKLMAAYFGDTSGRLWRHMVGSAPVADTDFTCNHPLHFSPTVVQLDRDAVYTSHVHEVYLVQVTNSNLDLGTVNLPPSQMIFWKETAQTDQNGNIAAMVKDTGWGNNGQIVLTAGTNGICGVTQTGTDGKVSCVTPVPAAARPTSTPLGVLRRDGEGFQVLTMWYVAPADGCTKGATYLTVHQMLAGVVEQRVGIKAADEPVTSPVLLRGRVWLFGVNGAQEITSAIPDTISGGQALPPVANSGTILRFNWSELLE